MNRELYRYTFGPELPLEEAEASLVLSLFAVGSLHGEAQVRLDAVHALNAERRQCLIDASTEVGKALNCVFVGFLRREFGEAAFRVERLDAASAGLLTEAAAV
jgi:hypothetical protein